MDEIRLGSYELTILGDAGPRVLGFRRIDGPQLFADLPGMVIEHGSLPPFTFIGGHRLWFAPEVPSVTYRPDDADVEIEIGHEMLTVTGPGDEDGIVKTIELSTDGTRVTVDHVVSNDGWSPVTLAPWAITQLVPGGLAVVPLQAGAADPDGVLPNRSVAMWPYTDPGDVVLEQTAIRIPATVEPTRTKVGTQNRAGWLAYAVGGEMFVKWAPLHRDDEPYPDLGSSVEVYRDHRFVELESLAPLVTLAPGAVTRHREQWELFDIGTADPLSFMADLSGDPETP